MRAFDIAARALRVFALQMFALPALSGLCAAALALVSAGGAVAGPRGATSADICRDVPFAGATHVVCEISPAQRQAGMRVDLHWSDGARPFGSLRAVEQALAGQGRVPLVTMNAGMYEPDLSPVGLFVASGQVQSPINLRRGGGNFYLRPNGVFFMARGKAGATGAGAGGAGVMETQAFARAKLTPDLATQSGPMLVIGGRIHPRILPDGESRKIRNGIGVRKDGTIVLAISRQLVSFGEFARLFRDALHCPDALYLDGSVSQLSRDGAAGREPAKGASVMWRRPLGPILSVSVQ